VRGSRLALWSTVAGVLVGVGITAGLVVAGPLRLPEHVAERVDAREEFLAAWARSRRGTFRVRSRVERRQPGGATLASPAELAQRPPDRLLRRFDGVSGILGGRPVVCAEASGVTRCRVPPDDDDPEITPGLPAADPAGAYEQEVQAELEAFRGWFRPPGPGLRPRYRVVRRPDRADGCFDLVLAVPGAEAPWGTDARLCFDPATGAPSEARRRFGNGIVETETAERIDPVVTAADLALPG
jgi:hypothetical protein